MKEESEERKDLSIEEKGNKKKKGQMSGFTGTEDGSTPQFGMKVCFVWLVFVIFPSSHFFPSLLMFFDFFLLLFLFIGQDHRFPQG